MLGIFDKAIAGQPCNAGRLRGRGVAAHQLSAHVGAVGEVQHYGDGGALGRVPVQSEKQSAMATGSSSSATKPISQ